jgi:tetratricopeptide (TPR) repeat protein
MSQLLSEAQKNYEEGRALMASSASEGQRKLNQAKQNIQKVRLVYPMNETAGLLDLRIEQQEDLPGFTANFATRVNNAIAGCRRGDLESYNMLLNLRTIDPAYPNWTAIIYQAEIDVGLRRRPLDPAVIAQSNDVLASARTISRDASRRAEALDLARQAITLNPENREAIAFFNELSAIPAGPPTLDPEAERMYQQAIAAIAQNNALGALTLVTAIYARDARYRNINRMIELERRARRSL